MIKSPIQKVSDISQSRAIGIIYGIYEPTEKDVFNKGSIKDANGFSIDSVVLGRAIPTISKYLDLTKNYFWVVYPRNKKSDYLHLQISGIWDPNNLSKDDEKNSKKPEELLKELNLKDNFFSIRGQLVFVNTQEKEIVVKINPLNRPNSKKTASFKITLKGHIPIDFINDFVSIEALREGNSLCLDSFEVLSSKIKNHN